MKTNFLKEQTYETLKNSVIVSILILFLFSCKKERVLINKTKTYSNQITSKECEVKKNITNPDSLNLDIITFFEINKNESKYYSLSQKGLLSYGFGKKVLCSKIDKNKLASSVFYFPGNVTCNGIYELHFKKEQSQISFNALKNELIRSSGSKKINNEAYNEFFDFMKRGLVFLLDKKNDTIIIIEYNLFGQPRNIKKIEQFIEKYRNSFDGILFSKGNTKIELVK